MGNYTGKVNYKDIPLYIDYHISVFIPAKYYLDNGDPGYPSEGGDIEIDSIKVKDSNIDIYDLLTEEAIETIIQQITQQNYF